MLSSRVKFSADRRTDRQRDGQTDTGKTICPAWIKIYPVKLRNEQFAPVIVLFFKQNYVFKKLFL